MRDFYLAAGTNMEVYTRQIGDTRVNSYAPVALREGSVTANDVAFAAIDIILLEKSVSTLILSSMYWQLILTHLELNTRG